VIPVRSLRFVVSGLSLCAAACDDPLKATEIVEEPRVLAARVEVDGDPGRAAPYPGERASVRFLVAAPEPEPALGFALVACRAAPANVGLARCAEPVFAEQALLEPAPVAPQIEFELPEPASEASRPRLLVKGVICANGSPRVTESPSTCTSGDQTLAVTLEVDLATPAEANQNPSFDSAELSLDGEPLTPPPALPSACAGAGLLEVPAGSVHRFELRFPESARDALVGSDDTEAGVESLLLSHFASSGELERAFSPIPAEAATISTNIDWIAPADLGPGGRLVRFWFVIRDLRGGSDFVERALCVVP
jgi:hypothetical protein